MVIYKLSYKFTSSNNFGSVEQFRMLWLMILSQWRVWCTPRSTNFHLNFKMPRYNFTNLIFGANKILLG